MNPTPKAHRSNLDLIVMFLALFVLLQFGLPRLFPGIFGGNNLPPQRIELTSAKSFTFGHHPVLTVTNTTNEDFALPERCPQPPVDISFIDRDESGKEVLTDLMANETIIPCEKSPVVPAGKSVTLSLAPWKYSLFDRAGTYEASLSVITGTGETVNQVATTRFEMKEPGSFTKLFRAIITKPFLNSLIFIASFMPGYNLGLAIILLTIVVKLLLLIPNQHALEGQKKLQLIQPKLDELKKKYQNDQKKLQEETLKLWKEYKINPMQSCLPMLLQFPILIGLFYVVRDGSVLALSRHLLYVPYQDLSWHFDPHFLGFDLTQPSVFVFPPLLVILQFIQMKLAFAKQKKKQAIIEASAPKKRWQLPEMNQQTVMLYVLPFMIGFFAIKFQAAVSLYWGVSTVFGIAQQLYVNREKIRV